MSRIMKCLGTATVVLTGACAPEAEMETSAASRSEARAMEVSGAVAVQSMETTWTFDGDAPGELPAAWKAEQTNARGEGAVWAVEQDPSAPSGGGVLALVDPNGASGSTFNIAWTDQAPFQDGRIEVKVRAGEGREDKGGGPIWRVQDKDNYYIARWNPLENNARLYFVQNGSRKELASADVRASRDEWHTLAIEHQGERITGSFDGRPLWEVDDDTFPDAGGIGVWTKADAASRFDDLTIAP
jgi:hypothetical protein